MVATIVTKYKVTSCKEDLVVGGGAAKALRLSVDVLGRKAPLAGGPTGTGGDTPFRDGRGASHDGDKALDRGFAVAYLVPLLARLDDELAGGGQA